MQYTGEKYSKYTGRPYLLKDSNELNILSDCMENRICLRYTTYLINYHRKTQGFDAVCKSTVNLAFKMPHPTEEKKIQKTQQVKNSEGE